MCHFADQAGGKESHHGPIRWKTLVRGQWSVVSGRPPEPLWVPMAITRRVPVSTNSPGTLVNQNKAESHPPTQPALDIIHTGIAFSSTPVLLLASLHNISRLSTCTSDCLISPECPAQICNPDGTLGRFTCSCAHHNSPWVQSPISILPRSLAASPFRTGRQHFGINVAAAIPPSLSFCSSRLSRRLDTLHVRRRWIPITTPILTRCGLPMPLALQTHPSVSTKAFQKMPRVRTRMGATCLQPWLLDSKNGLWLKMKMLEQRLHTKCCAHSGPQTLQQ